MPPKLTCPLVPFFFPTRILHIDDHGSYVRLLASLFGNDMYIEGYVSAREALEVIHQEYRGPSEAADLMHRLPDRRSLSREDIAALNVEGIQRIVYDRQRFAEISVIIVDYYMPEMNGLEFCRQLPHRNIGRILLTGRAERKVAEQALNEGLIDRFIEKSNPDVIPQVQQAVAELQWRYFVNGAAPVTETLAAGGFSFLQDAAVIDAVKQLLSITSAEMYLYGAPSGLFFLDGWGIAEFILVLPEEQLPVQVQQAKEANAPAELVDSLRSGRCVAMPKGYAGYDFGNPPNEEALLPATLVRGDTGSYYLAKLRKLDTFQPTLITGQYTWLRERGAKMSARNMVA